MREVGDFEPFSADLGGELAHLLMRNLEELLKQSEFVHELEGRGVDRIAPEVPKEIGVLLEHDDVHAGAGEQKCQHDAGGTAAHDATASFNGCSHRSDRCASDADSAYERQAVTATRKVAGVGLGRR